MASIALKERVKWDIRQGMIGADTFEPKHVVVVTWKNVTQAGIDRYIKNSFSTNSFQMVLATDEQRTYAIFNYIRIRWDGLKDVMYGSNDSHGMPAFVST